MTCVRGPAWQLDNSFVISYSVFLRLLLKYLGPHTHCVPLIMSHALVLLRLPIFPRLLKVVVEPSYIYTNIYRLHMEDRSSDWGPTRVMLIQSGSEIIRCYNIPFLVSQCHLKSSWYIHRLRQIGLIIVLNVPIISTGMYVLHGFFDAHEVF